MYYMYKLKFILIFFAFTFLYVTGVNAKTKKVDQIVVVQDQINQAYKLGYIDAAPLEMDFIEKKVIEAKTARDNRKKKLFAKLIGEIKVDLKIVKKRFEVNQLNKSLITIQKQNLESKILLDELRGQL